MNKLIKNYSYNFLYQIISVVIPLITAPYLARTLGPNEIGIYSYVNSIAILISTISMLGIFNYGNRQIAYVRDNKELLSQTFWSIMSTRLILGIIGTFAYFTLILLSNNYKIYFTIYYTYILANIIDCTWIYVGLEDMKWAVLKNSLTKIISLLGIFIFVNTPNDTWKYILLMGSSVLLSNVLAYSQLRTYVKKPRFIFKHSLNIIKESFYLFLPSLATTVYMQCDKIMIEFITKENFQISFYDYSEKIVVIPLTFITVLNAVIMPRLANEYANHNTNNIEKLVNNSLNFSLFFAIPMTLGMSVISEKLIPWYLGSDFIPTISAIKVLSPIIIFNSISGVFGSQYFTATNQINKLLISQVSAVFINIISNILLIPKYGFIGACITTVISSVVCSSIQYIATKELN